MKTAKVQPVRAVQYELRIAIEAPAERVWRALVDEIDAWWLADFHMAAPDSELVIEARPGGRMYEKTAGGGLLWYTVLVVEENRHLSLAGHLVPTFAAGAGPATSLLTLQLESQGGATLLRVSDALYGHVDDGLASASQSGWNLLFSDGLKAFVERAGRPRRSAGDSKSPSAKRAGPKTQ